MGYVPSDMNELQVITSIIIGTAGALFIFALFIIGAINNNRD